MSNKRLGKGIEALIRPAKEKTTPIVPGSIFVALKLINTNPNQPRKIFDKKKIEELADSIIEKGILTPLTVKKDNN